VPTAPDPALLNQVADHLAQINSTGTPNQRKTLVGALVDRVIITRPDRAEHRSAAVPADERPLPSVEQYDVLLGRETS
jgi:hypothetical protein